MLEKELRRIVYEECMKAFKEFSANQQEPKKANGRKYLKAKEVLDEFGISPRTLVNWQHRGLKYNKVGGKNYYLVSEIEKFIRFSSRNAF